jgi:hypothetical protein
MYTKQKLVLCGLTTLASNMFNACMLNHNHNGWSVAANFKICAGSTQPEPPVTALSLHASINTAVQLLASTRVSIYSAFECQLLLKDYIDPFNRA